MKIYRTNGAIGALLDEYERSINDLSQIINGLSDEEIKRIVDTQTKDPDCKSIQTILTHVLNSGFYYFTAMRIHFGEDTPLKPRLVLHSSAEYQLELGNMFDCAKDLFEDYPDKELEEYDNAKKMVVRWGQQYDLEQLFEHAIVHILRHRRQIERFIIKIKTE